MDTASIKSLFDNITTWKRGGQRAPHKPLLILYALSQCLNNKRYISFSEIDSKFKPILIEFGPTRKSYHTEYPFWRLKNDGLWQLKNAEKVALRQSNTEEIYDFLRSNKDRIPELASSILEKNFPASIHEDILQAVGIELEYKEDRERKRDPSFREKILIAYEYQCAVCGFNVRIDHSLVGLEAAHIKWHQAGGPDSENNGIALCSLHHKLFDRGAFTLSDGLKFVVSDRAHGTQGFSEWLMSFHGRELKGPQNPSYYPKPAFISWHFREVFRGQGRNGAGMSG